MIRRLAPLASSLVVALAAVSAHAEPSDSRAWAQRLFDEGRTLRREGKIAEACERFAASQKLDPAVGTLLNHADCSEKLDRLATAWATYKDAATLARVKGDAREKQAADAAARLEPRLSHLTIRVAEKYPDLVVKRGDDVIPDPAWGIALPVDGGTYTLRAQAPGRVPFETRIVIPAAKGEIVVDVPALSREPGPPESKPPVAPPAPAPAPLASGATSATPPIATAELHSSERPSRVPAIVALGVGVLGLGAGTFFAVRANDRWSDARGGCDATNRCNHPSYALATDARTDGNVATVGFVVGAAGLAAGALLWFLFDGGQR